MKDIKTLIKVIYGLLLFLLLSSCKSVDVKNQNKIFQKDNLIPWSIVGFDVKERTPIQRLEMLKRLGYTQYAYGYRPKHIPTMLQEWQLAKQKNIKIKAVWLYINLYKDKVGLLGLMQRLFSKT